MARVTNKEIRMMSNKSIQAFLLAIEIFNKPTIDYRLEGTVFFLCNAWELLLKAKLCKDGESIHYKRRGKEKRQTYTLSDCISHVMTNDKDPVRTNLQIISSLRNSATHYVIPEFEIIYMPFLSFCVKSYANKLYEYLKIDITDYIKTDFLSLFTNRATTSRQEIMSKYGRTVADLFEKKSDELQAAINDSEASIAMNINVNFVRINNKAKADYSFYFSRDPNDPHVRNIERTVDPNKTYPLTYHEVVNQIDAAIKMNDIPFNPLREPVPSAKNPSPNIFTSACLDFICKEYRIKQNTEYCYQTLNGKQTIYKYSPILITAVVNLIQDDPNFVVKIRDKHKKS